VLLSLADMDRASDRELAEHCSEVARILPVFGFYLQPAVGGRVLGHGFWREFCEIDNVVAIKVAPFNRYQTIDVIRAVAESGRQSEIALYTGNDDSIVLDLMTTHRFAGREIGFSGGLLGQWSAGTRRAAELLAEVKKAKKQGGATNELLTKANALTDTNAAIFDAANGFRGCIAGIHEVLVRQGLLAGRWCLDQYEDLSPGQFEEIDRVLKAYPDLHDDDFIRENIAHWLS